MECRGASGLQHVVVAGGGARNPALMAALERALVTPVSRSDAWGVDGDAREALVFGLLAVRHVLGQPSSDPSATGAARGIVLGKLSPAVPLAGGEPVR